MHALRASGHSARQVAKGLQRSVVELERCVPDLAGHTASIHDLEEGANGHEETNHIVCHIVLHHAKTQLRRLINDKRKIATSLKVVVSIVSGREADLYL